MGHDYSIYMYIQCMHILLLNVGLLCSASMRSYHVRVMDVTVPRLCSFSYLLSVSSVFCHHLS